MNMRSVVLALLIVAIMVYAVMPIAMPSEDAGSSVSVVSSTPEITAMILDPAEITLVPGISVEGTITVDVLCPNSVDWIECVELVTVAPETLMPLPIPLKLIKVDKERINAKYQLVMELPCNMPAGEYTLTVTVTDKEGNTATASASATVLETLAFSVTDVEFGSLAPGKSSEASSTVTNLGNVRFKFAKKDGIVPSDMSSGGSGIIEAQNIAVGWDWKTVIARGFFSQDESVKEVPFTLKVPFGTPPGAYTGRIVFTPTPVK
jgi:hypothetical protein